MVKLYKAANQAVFTRKRSSCSIASPFENANDIAECKTKWTTNKINPFEWIV